MTYENELVLWLGYAVGCLIIGVSVAGIAFCYCFLTLIIKDYLRGRFKIARDLRAYYSWQRFNRRYNKKCFSEIELRRAKALKEVEG